MAVPALPGEFFLIQGVRELTRGEPRDAHRVPGWVKPQGVTAFLRDRLVVKGLGVGDRGKAT
ncbi:MAG TPA: hypothetical protein VD767_08585, partial [Thermomicrobiales bacterium]|nr:hypothetical protein [Thermomicrobiales bacterium]